jgi:hypothetical protein
VNQKLPVHRHQSQDEIDKLKAKVKKLEKHLVHANGCSFYKNGPQWSTGLDGQDVDCDCGLLRTWLNK